MAEVKFVPHKGKKILLMDYSNSEKEDILKAIAETKLLVAKEPPKSVLGIVNVTGSGFNSDVSNALKDLAKHNEPYIKMSTVVGVDGIKRAIYVAVLRFTGRKNLVLKDSVEEAKDWLVTQ